MSIIFAPISLIKVVRGTTWVDNFQLVSAVTNAPIDLTGITSLLMRMREEINGPIILELSLANSRLVITNPTTGSVGIRVNSAGTMLFPANGNAKAKYVYDSVIERMPGEYEPAVSGKIAVLPQITRPQGIT